MTLNISLIGLPGSGKSTVAKAIAELTGSEVLSFASQVKKDVAMFLSVGDTLEYHNTITRMQSPNTKDVYRPMLQAYGAFRRHQDPEYWVNRVEAVLLSKKHSSFVVDDCRYFNEEEMLRRHGFVFVHLLPGATTREMSLTEASHESEKEWPNITADLTIDYQEGVDHQAKRILTFFSSIGGYDVAV